MLEKKYDKTLKIKLSMISCLTLHTVNTSLSHLRTCCSTWRSYQKDRWFFKWYQVVRVWIVRN